MRTAGRLALVRAGSDAFGGEKADRRGKRPAFAARPPRPRTRWQRGDEICATIPDPQTLDLTPQDIPIEIVYEDDDIAVINKPQGLTVHAGSGNLTGTLVNALLFRLKSLSSINGVVRPGIVHRIDKDTSGLLVVAKNDAAHLSLSAQIADKTCAREYLALCEGIFKEDSGRVETYIGRHPTDRIRMAVVSKEKGRYAATNYQVEARYKRGFTLGAVPSGNGQNASDQGTLQVSGVSHRGRSRVRQQKTEIPAQRTASARLQAHAHAPENGRTHDV